MERRLATILAADIVGYSSSMEIDEVRTLGHLDRIKKIVQSRTDAGDGRLFSRAGDGFLSEFQSPVRAVRAAFDIQRDLARERRQAPCPEMRIGLHLADIIVDGHDLLGNGVNIAARIESVSRPGSVTISEPVFEHVKRSAYLKFENVGRTKLKNIADPIVLYRVLGELDNHSYVAGSMDASLGSAAKPRENDRPSVAVLPFVNRSGDPNQDYIADGFADDLITELSRFNGLFVPSRNASLAYREIEGRPGEAGQLLGVDFVLAGSIRTMGARLRISVQLSKVDTGQGIWTERYDCTMDDLFDLQDEIASRIVAAVAGRVETANLDIAKRKRPADLSAYDCLLRGLEHHRLGGVTLEDAEQAYQWFTKSTDIDPNYARAHAWRACARSTLGEWRNDDWWDECVSIAQKALELDEADAEANRIMGSICMYTERWEKARYHFERALEINPNHAFVVGRAGELYNFMGAPEKALEMVKRAKRLDPFLPEYCRELEIVALYGINDFSKAVIAAEVMTRATRRSATYRVACAYRMTDQKKLEAAKSDLLRIDPDFSVSAFLSTEFYRDPAMRQRLSADLKDAGLPD